MGANMVPQSDFIGKGVIATRMQTDKTDIGGSDMEAQGGGGAGAQTAGGSVKVKKKNLPGLSLVALHIICRRLRAKCRIGPCRIHRIW